MSTLAIILAAGKSSRMNSSKSKVLHEVGHYPLLKHVMDLVEKKVIVISPNAKDIEDHIGETPFVVQEQPLGTGHAVMQALSHVSGDDDVIVLYGDTPLVTSDTIKRLTLAKGDCILVGMDLHNPMGYGRMILDSNNHVIEVIECLDASESQKRVTLCWGGVLKIKADFLKKYLPQISNKNAKQEYYLTSLFELLVQNNHKIEYIISDAEEVLGVNSKQDLIYVEYVFQKRMRKKVIENGAILEDPKTVYFSYDTILGKDVIVEPNVYFLPKVSVDEGTRIRSFSYLEGASIGKNCIIGPFARIRPDSVIEEKARVGNFVEVKNSHLKEKARINHLSYIGDSHVGVETNIGAGVITCNYDGFKKHETHIGDHVFVGSNTALVAPVKIGDGAIVGAGTVVTKPVPENALTLSRPTQVDKENGAERYRKIHDK